ncbi:unnamed protein product, partial [Prorocentrum cordatum]
EKDDEATRRRKVRFFQLNKDDLGAELLEQLEAIRKGPNKRAKEQQFIAEAVTVSDDGTLSLTTDKAYFHELHQKYEERKGTKGKVSLPTLQFRARHYNNCTKTFDEAEQKGEFYRTMGNG